LRVLNSLTAVCEFPLHAEATIARVKTEIHSKIEVPSHEQQIFFQGQCLMDDLCCLQDVVAASNATVHEGAIVELSLLRETKVENYEDLNLKEPLMRGIRSYGFDKPSQIQRMAIRPICAGRDVIVQAASGTGKTAAFLIGSLQRLDPSLAATQALVLAPTRELACPIQKVALALGEHLRVTSHACVGGGLVRQDIDILRQSPHVVVGTAGRVHDMIGKRCIRLDDLKTFVIDEMDEMSSRGFKGLMFETMELLPASVQLAVFSATMPQELLDHMKRVMRSPVHLQIKKDELTLEGIRQFYIAIEREEWKLDTLCDLLETLDAAPVIYCNTRRKVEFLAQRMAERHFSVSTMHAALDQPEREMVLKEFCSGSSRVLVSTDLCPQSLEHVGLKINYDLPSNMENYASRIGRSGRFGRRGVAVNFITQNDVRTMKDIERHYHTCIEEMPMDIADLI